MQSVAKLKSEMQEKLGRFSPPAEIELQAELIAEIHELKEKRRAVILGHNYMEPALFHFASDVRGDSLELCKRAAETDKDVIVFCGVEFMAETAKIINPDKTVLIPSQKAGCSLAASITADDVRRLRKIYPGVPIVTYVNTYADVKAESDYCCTSSNALRVIQAVASDKVIYLPDEFMAQNLARETGKQVIFPKEALAEGKPVDVSDLKNTVIAWHGRCEVHEKFTVEDIAQVRKQFPDVVVLAHPECPPEVVEASDFSGSTSEMIAYVKNEQAPHYLLLTECSMGDNIIAENPGRDVLRLCSVRCPHMNQITLEDTKAALEHLQYEVDVEEDIRNRAKKAIDRMLSI